MKWKEWKKQDMEWKLRHEELRKLIIERTKLDIEYLKVKIGNETMQGLKRLGFDLEKVVERKEEVESK